jgi:tubulin polyglutamylase TTLL6/13
MCFELLGFDVILTADMKPMLLEVNHAPSFNTDSTLDYEIKKALFVDMFRLLDMSINRKKEKINAIYEDKINRMTSK